MPIEALAVHLAQGRALRERQAAPEDWQAWRMEAMELVAQIPGTRSFLQALKGIKLPERWEAAEAILLATQAQAEKGLAEVEIQATVGDEEEGYLGEASVASSGLGLAMELIPHIANSPQQARDLRKALLLLHRELDESAAPDWQALRPALIRILEAKECLFLAILPYLAERLRE